MAKRVVKDDSATMDPIKIELNLRFMTNSSILETVREAVEDHIQSYGVEAINNGECFEICLEDVIIDDS